MDAKCHTLAIRDRFLLAKCYTLAIKDRFLLARSLLVAIRDSFLLAFMHAAITDRFFLQKQLLGGHQRFIPTVTMQATSGYTCAQRSQTAHNLTYSREGHGPNPFDIVVRGLENCGVDGVVKGLAS